MLADVRFGSKADIRTAKRNVRFTPESGTLFATLAGQARNRPHRRSRHSIEVGPLCVRKDFFKAQSLSDKAKIVLGGTTATLAWAREFSVCIHCVNGMLLFSLIRTIDTLRPLSMTALMPRIMSVRVL